MSSKSYKFQITNNQVTQVVEIDRHGRQKQASIDWDETYSLDGRDVIKTETERDGIEITRYSDTNGDGIFVKVSESKQRTPYADRSDRDQDKDRSSDDREQAGDDSYGDHDHDHDHDNNHDDGYEYHGSNSVAFDPTQPANTMAKNVMVLDQTIASGSAGADHFVVTQLQGNLVIQGFNGLQGDKLVFDLDNGVQTLAQLVSQVSNLTMNGQDMVIDFHGGDAQLVLVGIGPFGLGLEHVSVV